MSDKTTLGQTVYDAWAKAERERHSRTLPEWDELLDGDKHAWYAAARASRDRVFEDMRERFITGLYRVFGERV